MAAARRRKISADQLRVVPWKNGGGLTTEIAFGAALSPDQEWSWRVSAADVGEDGPFSSFEGIDRSIVVIEGAGLDLNFDDGRTLALDLNKPADFDGGAPLVSKLRQGPIRDFNVMVDRRYYRADLGVSSGPEDTAVSGSARSVLLVHVLDGQCTITEAGHPDQVLGIGATMIYDGETDIVVSVPPDARAVTVNIDPRDDD